MGQTIRINLVQGNETYIVQDLTGIVGLESSGITFSDKSISLSFISLAGGTNSAEVDDAVARLTRNIDAWQERARAATFVRLGPPVELTIRMGADLPEPTYGRGAIRWTITGGRVEQGEYPAEISGVRLFTAVFDLEAREGHGMEMPVLRAYGQSNRTPGAGGARSYIRAISDGGIDIRGGRLALQKAPLSHSAGAVSLHWKPICPLLSGTTTNTQPAYGHQFIYDIRHDEDGGAWWDSDAAHETTWYKELGAFPTLTVWEWDTSTLRVRNAADMSVYMSFSRDSGSGGMWMNSDTNYNRIAAVYALNRRVYVAFNTPDATDTINNGLTEINFETDGFRLVNTSALMTANGPISKRNTVSFNSFYVATTLTLPSSAVNDVHATYVPGRGQAVAVATGAGASIWYPGVMDRCGTAYLIDFNVTTYNDVRHVWLTPAGRLVWNGTNGTNNFNRIYMLEKAAFYTTDQTDTITKTYTPSTDPMLVGAATDVINDLWVQEGASVYGPQTTEEQSDLIIVGSNAGLTVIEPEYGNENDGAWSHYTTSYFTDLLFGSQIGYWVGGYQTGASVTDRSRGAHTLTVNGFTAGSLAADDWDQVNTCLGPMLIFDGANDYLSSTSADFNVANQALTFGAIIKAAAPDAIQYIINKGMTAGQRGYYLRINANNTVEAGISTDGTNWKVATSTNTIDPNGDYTLVAGKYDGANVFVYLYRRQLLWNYALDEITGEAQTGNIASSTDPLRVGCISSATTNKFAGQMSGVFVTKEVLNTAELRAYYDHAVGSIEDTTAPLLGSSLYVMSVCMAEDNRTLLIATGDASHAGALTEWLYPNSHSLRSVTIDAGIHRSVAECAGLLVASTATNRYYVSPWDDVYLFDYSSYYNAYSDDTLKTGGFAREDKGLTCYFTMADRKMNVAVFWDTAVASTNAISWTFDRTTAPMALAFTYGRTGGTRIYKDGALIGNSTFDGTDPSAGRGPTNTYGPVAWVGTSYDAAGPAGCIYDLNIYQIELSAAQVLLIERGRSEMPFLWLPDPAGKHYNRADLRGSDVLYLDNIPGDVAAGFRLLWDSSGNQDGYVLGARVYQADFMRPGYEAEDATYTDADTTIVASATSSGGSYITTTASTTSNVRRADIALARNWIEYLRLYGRFRLYGRLWETGVTPGCKVQFILNRSGSTGDWITEQMMLTGTGYWQLIDFGEVNIPSVWTPDRVRRTSLRDIAENGSAAVAWAPSKLSYYVEKPLGVTNDIRLDCIYLVPSDYSINSLNRTYGANTAFMINCRRGDAGALQVGAAGDLAYGYEPISSQNAIDWQGWPILLPVGKGTAIVLIAREPAQDTSNPLLNTLTVTHDVLAWVEPYFRWIR